jgi:ABC-2 type transport system permease protein
VKAIYFKEINLFFSSLIGIIAILVFLVITGTLLWIIPEYSILQYGFSSMEMLFSLAPILFLFIIPAITMRSISEEKANGTIELLFTKPLTDRDIVLGKYFAALSIVMIALFPTFIYYISIYVLGMPQGNIDTGGVMGSYIGLIFLASVFTAIGLFCSSLTQNQIVAFLLAAVFCAMIYWGFDLLSSFPFMEGKIETFIKGIGISSHYDAVSRGVVDTRDVLYFLTMDFIFILLTITVLESRKW